MNKVRPFKPTIFMSIKRPLFLATITAALMSGCAQNASTDETTSPPPVVRGAETAARVVVGQVVGTPAKVAMAAGAAAKVVAKKVEGEPNSGSNTSD